jgi:hypothetical protein
MSFFRSRAEKSVPSSEDSPMVTALEAGARMNRMSRNGSFAAAFANVSAVVANVAAENDRIGSFETTADKIRTIAGTANAVAAAGLSAMAVRAHRRANRFSEMAEYYRQEPVDATTVISELVEQELPLAPPAHVDPTTPS